MPTAPSPFPRRGRPKFEDDDERARCKTVRLPEDFIQWFSEAAKRQGLTWQDAAREALLAWGKKH